MRWTTTAVCAVYVVHMLLCINADAIEEDATAMSAGTPSACSTCRDNGVCDHAYKGSPGHFCHTIWWSGNKPCCCPQGYACDSDHFKCRCRKEVTVKDVETTLLIVTMVVLAFVITIAIDACVDMYKRRNEFDEEEGGGSSSRCRLFWRFIRTLKHKHDEAKSRQRRRARDRHHRHHHYHSKHNTSTTLNGDEGLVYGTAAATAGATYEFDGDTGGYLEFGGDTGSTTGWSFFDFAGDSGDTTSYDVGSSFAGDS